MGMLEIINLMSSKDGDELFSKIVKLLEHFDINAFNEDGSIKTLYEVCCDVAEVLNKGK